MFRSLVLGLAALALVVGGIVAEEYKGKLAKVDASAKKITIETKDGEKTFGYAEGLKVKVKGKDGDKEVEIEKAKAGSFVAVTSSAVRQRVQLRRPDVGPTPAGQVDPEHGRQLPHCESSRRRALRFFGSPDRHCFADEPSVLWIVRSGFDRSSSQEGAPCPSRAGERSPYPPTANWYAT